MNPLPLAYQWLDRLALPRLILEARQLLGVREIPGAQNAPEIMGWAKEVGLEHDYVADKIPWCGLFVAMVVKRAGWEPIAAPLWARNWSRWGDPSPHPALGDVLVFQRPEGGHVGFYIGEDSTAFHVLGGNQGDAVSIIRVAKNRLLTARRARWRVSQPESVIAYHLAAAGGLSRNEA